MLKRWIFKSGSTVIVDGAANLLVLDVSDDKIVIRSFENKFFVLGLKHKNHIDLYAFSQYETNVLPTELFVVWKRRYPQVVLERPPSKRAERIFDKDYRN
jgi:hypothetical protein